MSIPGPRNFTLQADRRSANSWHKLTIHKTSAKIVYELSMFRILCFVLFFCFLAGFLGLWVENLKIPEKTAESIQNQKSFKKTPQKPNNKDSPDMKGKNWIIQKGIFCFFLFSHRFSRIVGGKIGNPRKQKKTRQTLNTFEKTYKIKQSKLWRVCAE